MDTNLKEPVQASTVVPKKEAGKILRQNGYKVANDEVDAFVSLKDINKIYPNGVQAVYDFNIDISKNDFIVLVGPSGCGKSTTLRMIAGLEDITSGYLYIDKFLSNYTPSKNRDISMVFQNYALYPQMTVFDNIAFPLRSRKYRRPLMANISRAWNDVFNVLDNRVQEYIDAFKEASDKNLNFGTIVEYIATKLKICDDAAKLLTKYNIHKPEDLTTKTSTGRTLYENIKLESEQQIKKEVENVTSKGYVVDEQYRLTKDGEIQYAYMNMSKEEIRARVFEAAEILDLGPYLDRRPKELSGGQMQRVALGRAIVRNAKLFLMDEPLSNLDAKLRVQMRSEIVRIHEQIGATTIYVTHDQTEAMTMATKIVVMSKGWVQQVGTPQEIYDNPRNIFVATFIGAPATNIFNAEYENGTITYENGYTVKLSDDFVVKHDQYYKEKILDLERMLATPDFKKMHALKIIDKSIFNAANSFANSNIEKSINETLKLLKNIECKDEINNLLSPFALEKLEELSSQLTIKNKINTKKVLLSIKSIVDEIDDEYGKETQNMINQQLELLNDIDENSANLDIYNEFINNVNKAITTIKELNNSTYKKLLSKLEYLNFNEHLFKESKDMLLNIRKPLLTFEKIPSADIGKLHNAQVFSKEEIKIDNTLYYQKPKKKKKVAKVHVNLNSVDIEFVNNLYEVATNLLAKCKAALVGRHGVRVGIRPEDLHLDNEFSGNKTNSFTINSNVVELLGSELLIHTNWANTNMIAKISTGTLIKPHTDVELTINKDKIFIFDESSGDTI